MISIPNTLWISWELNQRHRVQAIWLILGANSACGIWVSDAWVWVLDPGRPADAHTVVSAP